jgi:hypothetical protein
MKDALHCNGYGLVVEIDRFWVVCSTGWADRLSGSEKGLDSLVAENDQGCHCPETGRERLVAAGVADPAHDVLTAKFLQIVGGVPGAVL